MMRYALIASTAMIAACTTAPPAPPTVAVIEPMLASTRAPCQGQTFNIYFGRDENGLSEIAMAVVDQVADAYAACDLSRIEIEGHTDAVGSASVNKAVAKTRAEVVMAALTDAGVSADHIDIIAVGETGATTASGETVPVNRKTVVTLIPALPTS